LEVKNTAWNSNKLQLIGKMLRHLKNGGWISREAYTLTAKRLPFFFYFMRNQQQESNLMKLT
jgi:hypothetical protein